MRRFFFLLVLLLSLNCLTAVAATQPSSRFERLSIEQGLSQNTVTAIVEDSQGFMWFGTREGLNRFDGYQFKVYRHSPQDPNSLSDNFIWTLLEDRQGNLWIGTANGGLNRYDRTLDQFAHYTHQADKPDSLSDNGVRSIFEDLQGQLWIGTNAGGLNRFNPDSESFSRWAISDAGQERIYDITDGNLGELWLATGHGVVRFDTIKDEFKRYEHKISDLTSISHNRVRTVVKDKQGQLWFGTDGGGLNRYDEATDGFERFLHDANNHNSLSDNSIISLVVNSRNELWIGTWGGGLNRFDSSNRRFEVYRHEFADNHSLSVNLIYSLYVGTKGLLWIGTSGGGVNKLDGRVSRFGHIRHQTTKPGSLNGNNIRSIMLDSQGTLWVGTRGHGLNRLDKDAEGFLQYQHISELEGSLSYGQVYTLFEDSSQTIWIGTNEGLNRFNRQTEQFKHYRHDELKNSISDNQVKHIIEAAPGILWIATHGGGVNRFDVEKEHFEVFRHDSRVAGSLSHDEVTHLALDANGDLWVATLGGLNRFDPNQQRFEHFRHDDSPSSISHDRVHTLLRGKDDSLWIGTARGLNLWLPEQQQFKRFGSLEGFTDELVLSVLEDNLGHLWLSGNNGLTRVDPVTMEFSQFEASDGLQSNEFNLNAAFASPDGELMFGGLNGFNRFYPEHISLDTQPPKVQLTDFLLFNQSVVAGVPSKGFVLDRTVNTLEQLTLTDRQSLVSFEFSSMDHNNPRKSRYAYKLIGWDEDWIYTDASNRLATYTKLDPGQYLFTVKASNRDGVWSKKGQSVLLQVLPPWYKTWQAYLIYVVGCLTIGLGLHHYRTLSLRKRAAQLELKVNQRTETINRLMAQKQRMFANVSHEFKTPLTLILNPLDKLLKEPACSPFQKPLLMMKRNGSRLLHMVEQLLELSKLESLPQQNVYHYYGVHETLKGLLIAYQPLFELKQLKVTLAIENEVILHLTQDALEMILTNLISNAVKYTPKQGEIAFVVKSDNKKSVITVSDSGIGISPKDQHLVFNRFTRASEMTGQSIPGAGIGLALVKELVETNSGSISLVSEPGKGSTFSVTLPVCQESTAKITQSSGLTTELNVELELADNNTEHRQVVKSSAEPIIDADKPTVLAIDDNVEMLELLKDVLSEHYYCLTESNPEQGLVTATQQLPDLVISDVMMPQISGFEVLKRLKSSPLTDHIPVILLTAKGDQQSRIKGWTEKADEYLDKPFNNAELVLRIENILSIRSLLRRRYQNGITLDGNQQQTNPATHEMSELEVSVEPEETENKTHQIFFDKVNEVLEKHYADSTLDVNFLADKLAMSQRQLGRKMKAVLDFTPTEIIRLYRLKKAAELLKQGQSPGSVAFTVGFSSHSYFSQCFKAQFDCLPSSYR